MNSEPIQDAGMMPEAPDESAAPAPESASATESCLPLDALSMPDEKDQMETPAVGDKVTYSADAVITRIEGNKAYVKNTSVNGNPIQDEPEAPQDGMADLETMAGQMPEEQ